MPHQENHSELRQYKGTGHIPASRITQNKIHTILLREEIKFLYRKKGHSVTYCLHYITILMLLCTDGI